MCEYDPHRFERGMDITSLAANQDERNSRKEARTTADWSQRSRCAEITNSVRTISFLQNHLRSILPRCQRCDLDVYHRPLLATFQTLERQVTTLTREVPLGPPPATTIPRPFTGVSRPLMLGSNSLPFTQSFCFDGVLSASKKALTGL